VYTKEKLILDLQSMGLKMSDAIMIHSSMKAIGTVEGGGETVIDAFLEYFSKGLVMMPAHTWAQMSEEYSVFRPDTEPACVGLLPNLLLKRAGALRSLHPTHSIVAYGAGAEEYIRGEEACTTPCSPGGCWDRLRHIGAKILLVGVTHIRNTFIHSVEEVYQVPERFTAKPVCFQIVMPDGQWKETAVYRHYNPYTAHISESYDKLTEAFYGTGAAQEGRLGDAECILCDAVKVFEVTGTILVKEKNCLMDREVIPREWWNLLTPASCHFGNI